MSITLRNVNIYHEECDTSCSLILTTVHIAMELENRKTEAGKEAYMNFSA